MRLLVLLVALIGPVCPEVFQTPLIKVTTGEGAANGNGLRSGDLGEHATLMENYRNARYLIEVEIGKEPTIRDPGVT